MSLGNAKMSVSGVSFYKDSSKRELIVLLQHIARLAVMNPAYSLKKEKTDWNITAQLRSYLSYHLFYCLAVQMDCLIDYLILYGRPFQVHDLNG